MNYGLIYISIYMTNQKLSLNETSCLVKGEWVWIFKKKNLCKTSVNTFFMCGSHSAVLFWNKNKWLVFKVKNSKPNPDPWPHKHGSEGILPLVETAKCVNN